jgi:hypothetical protein
MANLNQETGPREETVNKAQRLAALKKAQKDAEGISLADAVKALKCTKHQARYVLRAGEAKKILKRSGSTSTTVYHAGPKAQA